MVAGLAEEFTPASANGGKLSASNDYDMRLVEEILNEDRETRSMSANYKYSYHGSTFMDERSKTTSSDKKNYNTFMVAKKDVSFRTSKYY